MRSKILKIFQNIINIYVPHEIKKSNLLKMIPTVVKSSTFLKYPLFTFNLCYEYVRFLLYMYFSESHQNWFQCCIT